jgi:hypothetical protein
MRLQRSNDNDVNISRNVSGLRALYRSKLEKQRAQFTVG